MRWGSGHNKSCKVREGPHQNQIKRSKGFSAPCKVHEGCTRFQKIKASVHFGCMFTGSTSLWIYFLLRPKAQPLRTRHMYKCALVIAVTGSIALYQRLLRALYHTVWWCEKNKWQTVGECRDTRFFHCIFNVWHQYIHCIIVVPCSNEIVADVSTVNSANNLGKKWWRTVWNTYLRVDKHLPLTLPHQYLRTLVFAVLRQLLQNFLEAPTEAQAVQAPEAKALRQLADAQRRKGGGKIAMINRHKDCQDVVGFKHV